VLTDAMVRTLQSFHQKVCQIYITGTHIRPDPSNPEGKRWICPPSEGVLEEAGLLPIQDYIAQRRKSVENYIVTRPIYEQCLQSKPIARNLRQSVWWNIKQIVSFDLKL
jgi:hypothetical protein